MKWLGERSALLAAFLKDRYADNSAFRAAWGLGKKDPTNLDAIHFFGPNSNRYKNGNDTLRADMDAFYAQVSDDDAIEDEENDSL
jgi:hypothetical protein